MSVEHQHLTYYGYATEWYFRLYQDLMSDYQEIACRQGLAYESPHSFSAVIPSTDNNFSSMLASAHMPRRGNLPQRITFSILYSLRRLLGYHDTALVDKYPILAKYIPMITKPFYSRSTHYNRLDIPNELQGSAWIHKEKVFGSDTYFIDQFERAVFLLGEPENRLSKRALIDFGEGYKARCVLSWLFVNRNEKMRIYQSMRSNDLTVGLPNNLCDARLAQGIIAASVGSNIGEVHHQSMLMQIYKKDIAGVDCDDEMKKLLANAQSSTIAEIANQIKQIPIVEKINEILYPYLGKPSNSGKDSIKQYHSIMNALELVFWDNNAECKQENRHCVEHLIGRHIIAKEIL